MKRIVRSLLIVLVVLLLVVLAVPYLFKGKLTQALKQQINKELNAVVDFGDTHLSLFRSFPSVSLGIEQLSIVNRAPFEGDTLFYAGLVELDMPLKTLFSGGVAPYTIDHFRIENARVRLVSDEEGRVNYDIARPETTSAEAGVQTAENPGRGLTLKAYELEDFRLTYEDQKEGMFVVLDSLDHKGSGDLSARKTILSTETSALFTLIYDETAYLQRNFVDWDADMELDLEAMSFVFKENTAHINRLPLVFDGGMVLKEEGTGFDLRFETPSSDFAQFLSLIPEKYSGDLEGVDARGTFTFKGEINGMLTEELIPEFRVHIGADEAFFKYADMPLSMKDIIMRGELGNATGKVEDTFLRLDTLHFDLGGDRMDVQMLAEKLGGNPEVALQAAGVLNLENFARLMPSETLEGLKGIIDMNVRSSFDMQAVEQQAYDRINIRGRLRMKEVQFTSDYLPGEVVIDDAMLGVTNKEIAVENARIRTGESDLELQGSLRDYLNMLSEKGVVHGQLDLQSERLVVADFMVLEETDTTPVEAEEKKGSVSSGEDDKVREVEGLFPPGLELGINGTARKVIYSDMELTDAKAKLALENQDLKITELSSRLFGGRVALNGLIKGQTEQPEYQVSLNASEFDFADAFTQMDILKNIAPIARIFDGELDGTLNLSGMLDQDLNPVLSSLAGNLLGQLKVEEVKKENLGVVNSLNDKLDFVDLGGLTGKELKAALDFADGKVSLKPLDVNVKGMHAVISGGHFFNGNMDYTLVIDVPASYLGNEVKSLAAKLNVKDFDSRTVPVEVKIGGEVRNPAFTTNLDKSVENFITELSREKKEELTRQGVNELGNLVGKVLGQKEASGSEAAADSTKTAPAAEKDAIKEAAGNILNSLFNKKKKDTTSKQ